MLECVWPCSMNPNSGCNYPDCLPKEEIVNSVVQYCNKCQAWEHIEFTTDKSRCLKCNTIRGSY